ncbi:hypothetical protein SUGI_0205430 [Cryptomeria japonica]|nr:hypothetical protein SUGI_0205430 [Cryptomeria japonica]
MLMVMVSTVYCRIVELVPSEYRGKGHHYKPLKIEIARFATSGSPASMGNPETSSKGPRSLATISQESSMSLENCVSYLELLAEEGYDTDNENFVPKPCCRFFENLGNEESEAYMCENVKKIFGKFGNYYAYVEAGLGIVAKCKNKSPAAFSCKGQH